MARRKKPEDQPEENTDPNAGSDDTFGLPEIEYEPINRETTPAPDVRAPEPEPATNQPEYIEEQPITHTTMERDEVRQNEYTYNDDDEGNSPWPKILGVLALLLLVGAGVWYFVLKRPADRAAAAEKAKQEELTRAEASRLEEGRAAEQRRIAEDAQRKADSVATAAPPAGTIETLNERTGRYYVVIASAIDGDLLMDYAKKLSEKGVNPKIIPPFGNVKFHRLTVAEGETFAATQQTADGLKSEYNEGAWVIKY
ncbi:MAG: SPOR domain-containing protein [Cyclobacteriaceae bacterium]